MVKKRCFSHLLSNVLIIKFYLFSVNDPIKYKKKQNGREKSCILFLEELLEMKFPGRKKSF